MILYINLKDAEVVQELTFQRENDATHKVEGVSNYLTKEAPLNTSMFSKYDLNKRKHLTLFQIALGQTLKTSGFKLKKVTNLLLLMMV